MTPDEIQPEFFIDRSLGRRHLAAALRDLGLTVHTMASAYGEAEAQRLADELYERDHVFPNVLPAIAAALGGSRSLVVG
jgi:hypothetical protein